MTGHLRSWGDAFLLKSPYHACVKPLYSPSVLVRYSVQTSCFQISSQSVHVFISEPFNQYNFFPPRLCSKSSGASCWLPPHSPGSVLIMCPKRALQSSTTLPCSVSFPDTELPCKHLLTHELYPIHLLLAFLILPLSLFQKSLCFLSCSFPLPLKSTQMISNFPIWFFYFIVSSEPASPPASFPLLGSSSLVPATLLLRELQLPMTKPCFCSSLKSCLENFLMCIPIFVASESCVWKPQLD